MALEQRGRAGSWWRPGVGYAAERDVGEAIYGLILATSVIAVSRQYVGKDALVTAITVIGTGTVFWLAHVYSEVLAAEVREQHLPSWPQVRGIVSRAWPIVQAGILPTLVLLLGPAGALADTEAQDAALLICLLELAGIGIVVAKAGGARGILVLVSGMIAASFGVAIIVLKVLVH